VSSRFHAPDGILFLFGRGVLPGTTIRGAEILDVAPTLLALAGLPPGCDMPGGVLLEALDMDRAPRCIESYDESGSPRRGREEHAPRGETEEAMEDHLRALGYLGGDPGGEQDSGDRVLATIHFHEGRYSEAARLFAELLEAEPDDARLEAGLAAALGALGRSGDALRHLERALELDPLNPVARYNRGLLRELRGERDRAAADYRRALRSAPDFEPARRALVRLTGERRAHPPVSPDEQAADRLAGRARDAARRGAYERAMELLDRATAVAPDYPLVHQYRSNVAYLLGDLEVAEEALERALELEPSNELYRSNLREIRRRLNDTVGPERTPGEETR
jgi:tetratricopeptide (TPR) repeat protein